MADEMVRRRGLVEPSEVARLVEERAEQRLAQLHHERIGLQVIDGGGEPSRGAESPPEAFAEGAPTEEPDETTDAATDEHEPLSLVELYPPPRFPDELPPKPGRRRPADSPFRR